MVSPETPGGGRERVLSVPPESRRHELPRGERQTSQSACLFTGERQQRHPATPRCHMGARKHMLNDSIYSPRHHIFIFASLFFFSLMVLSICTPSFSCPSPHVDVAFEKCAASRHRLRAGVPGSGRGVARVLSVPATSGPTFSRASIRQ